MVYWRIYGQLELFIACMSKDAVATRQVRCLPLGSLTVSRYHARGCLTVFYRGQWAEMPCSAWQVHAVTAISSHHMTGHELQMQA